MRRRHVKKPAYLVVVWVVTIVGCLGIFSFPAGRVAAATSSGSLNVTATVVPTAPTIPAVIDSPTNNTNLETTPLVVTGTCGVGLTVRVFNNGQLSGTSTCAIDGTFSINITLNYGSNNLTALNYDSFDQAGPASAAVNVFVNQPPPGPNPVEPRPSIAESIGSRSRQNLGQDKLGERPLFEGTLLEPLAKTLRLGPDVSYNTNRLLNVVLNILLLVATIVVGIILLLAWKRRKKTPEQE